MTPSASTQPQCVSIRNRANAQHSTGSRTESGKQRSALNALTHGLTATIAVLPSEDPAAYEQHRRQFLDARVGFRLEWPGNIHERLLELARQALAVQA
jgi:hypothetical protein